MRSSPSSVSFEVVPLEREAHVGWLHSAAVVRHLDQLEPAGNQPDPYASRAGIESVFKQFLKSARGPLDHLARGDAIDEVRGQPSY